MSASGGRAARVDPDDLLAEGSRFGPYVVEALLGAGTHGAVYRVRKGNLGRRKALKVLRRGAANDPSLLARFDREARALARLHDENVVQVEDLGEVDGRRFIEMEFLEGQTLAEALVARRRWTLDEALDVILPVASAMHVAHTASSPVVHRDLKPDNIFLAAVGAGVVPKVIDFGVAHAVDDAQDMTVTGQQIGTPSYMSPEQVRGQRELDGRSDQWSLAVILFVMLTGRRPFHAPGSAFQTGVLITAAPTPRLQDDGVSVPWAAEEALRRALAKDPSGRFPTMRDFGLALAPFARPEARSRFEARWGSAPSPTPPSPTAPTIAAARDPSIEATTILPTRRASTARRLWQVTLVLASVIFVAAVAVALHKRAPNAAPVTTAATVPVTVVRPLTPPPAAPAPVEPPPAPVVAAPSPPPTPAPAAPSARPSDGGRSPRGRAVHPRDAGPSDPPCGQIDPYTGLMRVCFD